MSVQEVTHICRTYLLAIIHCNIIINLLRLRSNSACLRGVCTSFLLYVPGEEGADSAVLGDAERALNEVIFIYCTHCIYINKTKTINTHNQLTFDVSVFANVTIIFG